MEAKKRGLGLTESSWLKALQGGTGVCVLAILVSSEKLQPSHLENALIKLQNSHPILRSRIRTTNKNSFSIITPPTPNAKVKSYGISTTNRILQASPDSSGISPLQLIAEHELNINVWNKDESNHETDLLFASAYSIDDGKWVLVLRLHVIACDHTTSISLLRDFMTALTNGDEEDKIKEEVNLAMEELIPKEKAKKGWLSRGMDMLGYSLTAFRLTHLEFSDVKSARSSKVVRFQLSEDETRKLLLGCERNGIKLCGALATAGLMAARGRSDRHNKYAVVTFSDCRATLDPPLSDHDYGFYYAAIMNTHATKGTEERFWDTAKRTYQEYKKCKDSNKHFTDLADLNFLMCKGIENPSLTPSSSLRTIFMAVMEDTVVDNSTDMQTQLGVDDYFDCSSVHGIGPSIQILDIISRGRLNCVCVYPYPLHSREQMQVLVDTMKSTLVDAANAA